MTTLSLCPCNPNTTYQACCGRYHTGEPANNPQTLMRARYSAYVKGHIEFIIATSLPVQQAQLDTAAMTAWSQSSQWLGLEVLTEILAPDLRHATVEFIAHWQDAHGPQQHQEKSLFIKPAERWYFYDPNVPLAAERNAPCPCGSQRKFKSAAAHTFKLNFQPWLAAQQHHTSLLCRTSASCTGWEIHTQWRNTLPQLPLPSQLFAI